MEGFDSFINNQCLKNVFKDKLELIYWEKNLKLAYLNKIDTWDYQWFYTIWRNNGLSIRPDVNLVQNIGFSETATHTKKSNLIFANMIAGVFQFPLVSNIDIQQNKINDIKCSRIRFKIIPFYKKVFNKIFRGDGFITISIYNNRGTIIYVSDKDSKYITAIDVKTNEILGKFYSHTGTIWHLAISDDDNTLISCGADMTLCFFNATNGELIYKINGTPGIPKQVSVMNNKIAVYYDSFSKLRGKSYIAVYDLDTLSLDGINLIKQIETDNSNKLLVLKWFDSTKIIMGNESGLITIKNMFDESESDLIYNFHTGGIKSLVFNNARNKILTGSLDV